MARTRHWVVPEDEQAEANRQTASLAGLAVALLLVVVGLYLIHTLSRDCAQEDCALSGRTNCQFVQTGPS